MILFWLPHHCLEFRPSSGKINVWNRWGPGIQNIFLYNSGGFFELKRNLPVQYLLFFETGIVGRRPRVARSRFCCLIYFVIYLPGCIQTGTFQYIYRNIPEYQRAINKSTIQIPEPFAIYTGIIISAQYSVHIC